MKKSLLILSLLIFWVTLAWCSNQIIETAEQKCVDNNWEVTTDELWNNICLFNAHERCQISEIEAWTCGWLNNEFDDSDYTEYSDPVKICEYNGWKIVYDETKNESPMCYFLEAEWCSLASIDRWDCVFLSDESNYLDEDKPCRLKVELVCPEWIDECYENMHAWFDIVCPVRDELFGCEYKEV